jgi:FkbM family methyltransferase
VVRTWLRSAVEGTVLADLWRTTRDDWNARRSTVRRTPWGFRFAGPEAMQTGRFERQEVELIDRALRDADCFVDVGAHVGYFTCYARQRGVPVVAIEPTPQNLALLYRNLDANDWHDTEVWPLALGDASSVAPLFGSSTGASLVEGWAGAAVSYRRLVPVTTLDRILAGRQAARLVIKVDVEGYEYRLLQGASRTLHLEPRPVWLIEICLREHTPGGQNPNFRATFELFWAAGYRSFLAEGGERAIGEDDVAAWIAGEEPPSHNFVFRA